ncbi:MAG: hypothetical protein Q8P76_03840 [bacterium]|nr:hypothetical protein [bacterium]
MKKALMALVASLGLAILAVPARADDSALPLNDSSSTATADTRDPSQWEVVAEQALVAPVENPDQIPLRVALGTMYLRAQDPEDSLKPYFYEYEIFGKVLIRYWPKTESREATYLMLVDGKWQEGGAGMVPTAHLVTKCRLFRRSPMLGIQLKLGGKDGKVMAVMVRPEPKK